MFQTSTNTLETIEDGFRSFIRNGYDNPVGKKVVTTSPGAEFMVETDKWYVVKMSRNDELGEKLAVYYGGNQKGTSVGETRWCTS